MAKEKKHFVTVDKVAEAKPPVIRIRGDARVPYEKIIQLMDELKKADLLKFTFDTLPVSK